MREFATGATRDDAEGKPDYTGYYSPLVTRRFGEYMLKHQRQADGTMRGSDNWKGGMPRKVYHASLKRHMLDVDLEMDGYESRDGLEDALAAIIFNAQGLLYEVLLNRDIDECYTAADEAAAVLHECRTCKHDAMTYLTHPCNICDKCPEDWWLANSIIDDRWEPK